MLLPAPAGGYEQIQLMEVTSGKEKGDLKNTLGTGSDGFNNVVNLLEKGISSVNESQIKAQNSIEDLATGKAQNLHDVVLTVQEASMAFQFALRTRNKMIEAYQEVMRMQV